MATAMTDLEDRWEGLRCSLCLEVFTQPKLLPCSHTFCLQCLVSLTSRRPKKFRWFPCPQCRESTNIPKGGVSAFQSNFYLREDDLERARSGNFCPAHADKSLDYYCVSCDKQLCISCKLTEHERHHTQDLHQATARAKEVLKRSMHRLPAAFKSLREDLDAVEKEKRERQEKKQAVEKAIRNRHATVVSAADRYRDQALESLNMLTDSGGSALAEDIGFLRENLDELNKLEKRVKKVMDDDSVPELLSVAKEVNRNQKIETAMRESKSLVVETSTRPVLRFSGTTTAIVRDIRHFVGRPAVVDVTVKVPTDTVVKQFQCGGQATDTEVFSICPAAENEVYVSYEMRDLSADFPSEKLNQRGEVIVEDDIAAGKASYYCSTRFVSVRSGGTDTFMPKSRPEREPLRLKADLSAKGGSIVGDSFYGQDTKFFLLGGVYRAFDVDANEEHFVTVEEAAAPDSQRIVKLYQKPLHNEPAIKGFFKSLANVDRRGFNAADCMDTYTPPPRVSASFQPADVCFHWINGRQLLLIADEVNDEIHVVDVVTTWSEHGLQTGKKLVFLRYLAPGSPLLIQPTALNTDSSGRLWVACRGGSILTVEPREMVKASGIRAPTCLRMPQRQSFTKEAGPVWSDSDSL